MSLPTLRTSRLLVRGITQEDVGALYELFSDREQLQFWGHPPIESEAEAEELVAEIQALAAAGDLLQWGIEIRASGDLVGTATLAGVDRTHRRAELGLILAPRAQGDGRAVEAATALLDHAFDRLGLHRVTADVDPRNDPALRLVERLGFEREGRLREHYHQRGEWQDGVLFGLLRREWEG